MLSENITQSSIYDKDYRKMILMYEKEIERNENSIYYPICLASLCNLHKHHKHAGAAMIALDELHYQLDNKPKLQKDWDKMLNQVREMVNKQGESKSEKFQNVVEMVNSQVSQLNNNQQNTMMIISLLTDRITEFEKIQNNRNQVKIDKEHLEKD